MRCLHPGTLLLLAPLLLASLLPLDAQGARWFRAVSEHFEVLSDLPEDEMRQLAVDLEYFELVLVKLMDAPEVKQAPRVVIYAFKDGGDYADVGSPGTAGLYSAGAGRPAAVIFHPVGRRTHNFGRQVLFHEYVHHFVGRFVGYRLPAWYNEGLAEYLSTFEVDGDVAIVGKPPADRAVLLDRVAWMDTGQLFTEGMRYMSGTRARRAEGDRKGTRRVSEQAMLYALGWYVAHHLNSKPELAARMSTYLQLINSATPVEEAFEQAFERTFLEFHQELREKWSSGQVAYRGFKLPTGAGAPEVSVERLPIDNSDYWIAEAQVRFSRHSLPKRMRRRFEKELKRLPADAVEWRLRTMLNLGELANDMNELDEADAWLGRARELDATSPGVASEQIRTLLYRAAASEGDPAGRQRHVARTREIALAALEVHPTNARLLGDLAASFIYDDSAAAQAGIRALGELQAVYPQHVALEEYAALLYAEAGLHDRALESISYELRFARTPSMISAAEQTREVVLRHREVAAGNALPVSGFVTLPSPD